MRSPSVSGTNREWQQRVLDTLAEPSANGRYVRNAVVARPRPEVAAPDASDDEPLRRRDLGRVWEDNLSEGPLRKAELIGQRAFEDAPQIGRRIEVAALIQTLGLQTRPVGDDPPARDSAPSHQRDRSRSVIGALGAVDASGAAELGNCDDDRFAPCCAESRLKGVKGRVKALKALGKQPLGRAFVLMGVEPVEGGWSIHEVVSGSPSPQRYGEPMPLNLVNPKLGRTSF